ncbi:glycoside hydrolase family 9 protein [Colwellia echini]|uniref:Endoglucanase n=1 Tax=Colwellia echini TaxID=1982103 RepID=A0ABY3MVA9_9GAMM|nr:glycoside hydrolase family 9 protein [Colwellia echini]TYK65148.1 tandem-95 repeat protein [Colwellia echini]
MKSNFKLSKISLATLTLLTATATLGSFSVNAEIKPVNSVRVNQHGYLPSQPKHAVYTGAAGETWQLKDSSGEVVATGKTTDHGTDIASGDTVSHIDFSNVSTKGDDYVLQIGSQTSYPFKISDYVYTFMKEDALMYFYHQRFGMPVLAEFVGEEFAREAGHAFDNNLACDDDLPSDWPSSVACTYSLNVEGGHADAGDYGGYVVNGGYYTWLLQHVYEANPAAYPDGSLLIPESSNGIPDILDEARIELDFIARMQVPQNFSPYPGMIHHKKSWQNWAPFPLVPADDNGIYWSNPQSKRTIKPVSTAATLNGAAVMAQAARLWQNYPQAPGFDGSTLPYYQTLIEKAELAWDAAVASPALFASADASKGSGPYNDDKVSDEFYWAATELYLTTKKEKYKTYLLASPHFAEFSGFDWAETHVAGSLSLLIHQADSDLTTQQNAQLVAGVSGFADTLLNNIDSEGYMTPITATNASPNGGECTGDHVYYWGSIGSGVLSQGIHLASAHRATGEQKYLDGVTRSMDHVLGINALDRAYMTGYGENPTTEPHHRFWLKSKANPVTAIAEAVSVPYPGAVAGGPQNDLVEDGTSGVEAPGTPCVEPAKSFSDHWNNYSSNEITVNWNANLVAVLAYIEEAIPAPQDTVAPQAPTNIVATPTSGSSIEVSWNSASDNAQVRKYKVYMKPEGGSYDLYDSTMSTFSSFVPLTPNTQYCFKVASQDYIGLTSVQSSEICTTTSAATAYEIYYQPDNSAMSDYVGTGATVQPEAPKTNLGKGWYHYEFHQAPSYSFHFSMPNWGSSSRFSLDGTGNANFTADVSDFNNEGSIWLTSDKTFHKTAPALTPIDDVVTEPCLEDCPNNAPSALGKTVNGNSDETLQINLTASDSDGTITSYQVSTDAMHGLVTISDSGVATYQPEAGYIGNDSFSFTVTDDDGADSQPAQVSITLTQVCGDACIPVAQVISASTTENTAVDIALVGTDSNGVITGYAISTQPVNGTATLSTDSANANIVNYLPNSDFVGIDSFQYFVTDNEGQNSEVATVNIDVIACGVACDPIADDKSATTTFNSSVTITLSATDDGEISAYDLESMPNNGSVEITNDTAIYTPNTDFAGDDSFSYSVTDNDGNVSNIATVNITVEQDDSNGNGGNNGGGDNGGNGSDIHCDIVVSSWNSGYTTAITITNTGSSAVNDWQVAVNLPDGQTIGNSWSGEYSGTTGNITLSNAPWNGSLAPNASTTLGFQASYSGALVLPTCE